MAFWIAELDACCCARRRDDAIDVRAAELVRDIVELMLGSTVAGSWSMVA